VKAIVLLLILLFTVVESILAQQPLQPGKAAGRTSSGTGVSRSVLKLTGHYRVNNKSTPNSMEVEMLPKGKIKFHILALWVSSYNRDNVHNGEVQGVVDLTGNTATYQDEHCRISIKFTSSTAIVKQADEVGDCDFGANVTATGTYRKIDSRKPKFDN